MNGLGKGSDDPRGTSNPRGINWAGIGVIVAILVPLLGYIATQFNRRETIRIDATDCAIPPSQCINVGPGAYGEKIITNSPPDKVQVNSALYVFSTWRSGQYELWVEYASKDSRPVRITLNNKLIVPSGLAETTLTWGNPRPFRQALVTLEGGKNTLELYRSNVFPHIRRVEFRPVE